MKIFFIKPTWKVLLKFFELLSKNFLGMQKPIALSNSDQDDLEESFTFKNHKPSNETSIKLLKQSNTILNENKTHLLEETLDNAASNVGDEPKKPELSEIIRSLIKKIISFFGKRDRLSKRDKQQIIRALINYNTDN